MTFRFEDQSRRGQPGGYASLDGTGHLPAAQQPFGAIGAYQAALLGGFYETIPGFVDPAHLDFTAGWLSITAANGGGDFVVGWGAGQDNSEAIYAETFANAIGSYVQIFDRGGNTFIGSPGSGKQTVEIVAGPSQGAKHLFAAQDATQSSLFEVKHDAGTPPTYTDAWFRPPANAGSDENRIEFFSAVETDVYSEEMIQISVGDTNSYPDFITIDVYSDWADPTQNYAQIYMRTFPSQTEPSFLLKDNSAALLFSVGADGTVLLRAGASLRDGDGTDPNAIVTANGGSLILDHQTPALWMNTDGGSGWRDISRWGDAANASIISNGDPTGIVPVVTEGDVLLDYFTPALWIGYSGTDWGRLINAAPDGTLLLPATLPTSDPHVAGSVWRDGNDLKVSTG